MEVKYNIICNAFKLPFNTQTIPPGSININPIKKFNKYININLLLIISELFTGNDKRFSISRLPNKIPFEYNIVKNNIAKLDTDTIYAGINFCCPNCTNVLAVMIL